LTQLARLERLRVFGTASAGKRDYVQAQGAEPIDYRNEDFVQVIAARTGGAGVDAAFDAIGLDNFRRSYQALGDGGSLITYGLYRATLDAEPEKLWHVASEFFAFQWQKMMWRWFGSANKTVSFYSITDVREKHPDWFREDLASLFQLLAEGRISPRVWKVLPLSEAAQAHRMIEEGEVEGKIVLTTAGHRTR
jgi:NADPH2:quinone reductase